MEFLNKHFCCWRKLVELNSHAPTPKCLYRAPLRFTCICLNTSHFTAGVLSHIRWQKRGALHCWSCRSIPKPASSPSYRTTTWSAAQWSAIASAAWQPWTVCGAHCLHGISATSTCQGVALPPYLSSSPSGHAQSVDMACYVPLLSRVVTPDRILVVTAECTAAYHATASAAASIWSVSAKIDQFGSCVCVHAAKDGPMMSACK
jgi:hypothetical protein